jgi:tryptophan synthase beta chain
MFYPFITDTEVKLIGIEAAGLGLNSGKHSASLTAGQDGVFHGSRIKILQEHEGQIRLAHSISAGLDYPGVGPEHCHLWSSGRAEYVNATDKEAIEAVHRTCRLEGILPALESAHAISYLEKLAQSLNDDSLVVVCLSGPGDKDVETVAKYLGYEVEQL